MVSARVGARVVPRRAAARRRAGGRAGAGRARVLFVILLFIETTVREVVERVRLALDPPGLGLREHGAHMERRGNGRCCTLKSEGMQWADLYPHAIGVWGRTRNDGRTVRPVVVVDFVVTPTRRGKHSPRMGRVMSGTIEAGKWRCRMLAAAADDERARTR